MLEAVRQYGHALEYASTALKDDHGIVLEAVKQNGGAVIRWAHAQRQHDSGN